MRACVTFYFFGYRHTHTHSDTRFQSCLHCVPHINEHSNMRHSHLQGFHSILNTFNGFSDGKRMKIRKTTNTVSKTNRENRMATNPAFCAYEIDRVVNAKSNWSWIMMPPPAAATAVTLLSTTHSFYNVNFKVISNRNMFSNVILSVSLVHNNKLAHFDTAESGTTRYAMWIFNPLMRTTEYIRTS